MRAFRIPNLAPIGSLLKRPMAAKRKPKSSARLLDQGHLDAIRRCPCLKCGLDPAGTAAHVRMSSAPHGKPNAGMQVKPDDKWVVPLCTECHGEQHRIGELTFWNELGVNPVLVSLKLYAASPNIEAMRAVIVATGAER